ncbi:hypothetical protein LCGC14_2579160 [marine sediment metagenome]|uniref:Uncharacterized protein n=1 Tax=marine sediment metagenome TaxID=412755 RepID=A0A0F9CR17_9ZZZZ
MATAMHNGRLTIAATGTPEALASAQEVDWVKVWCPLDNERVIRVGQSTVSDTNATTEGLPIIQGAKPELFLSCDLGDLYVVGFATDKIYYVASSGYTLPI